MSNENNDTQEQKVEEKVELIAVSLTEYERKIDIERAYLLREGVNPEKARKKAKEIIDKKYKKVSGSVDYSNWAGQKD